MGEPEKYININIREFVHSEVDHLEQKMNITHLKNDEALRSAKDEMNRRLEGMNEFRKQLEKQTVTFLSREEYEAKHQLINHKIEGLSKMVYIGVGILIVVQIAIGVVLHFMPAA